MGSFAYANFDFGLIEQIALSGCSLIVVRHKTIYLYDSMFSGLGINADDLKRDLVETHRHTLRRVRARARTHTHTHTHTLALQ